ncbi:MAG: hypothetical protein JXA90_13125 [Planctomycetes bacterium]|nr:hypothetical protein [Planctomycetota bacterium]
MWREGTVDTVGYFSDSSSWELAGEDGADTGSNLLLKARIGGGIYYVAGSGDDSNEPADVELHVQLLWDF